MLTLVCPHVTAPGAPKERWGFQGSYYRFLPLLENKTQSSQEQNVEKGGKEGKGGTKWEKLNVSAEHPKSGILTSSHGAILWIMSFRWPIIRSSWKSYGNVSVHSVSNCKILGPNFLIRAWNGNRWMMEWGIETYLLTQVSHWVCHWTWGQVFKEGIYAAPAKPAHMHTKSVVHK